MFALIVALAALDTIAMSRNEPDFEPEEMMDLAMKMMTMSQKMSMTIIILLAVMRLQLGDVLLMEFFLNFIVISARKFKKRNTAVKLIDLKYR